VARPIILIAGRYSDHVNEPGRVGIYSLRILFDAVAQAGGEAVLAWPDTTERAARLVELADGVILPGGNDLDLRPFGIPDVHPREVHSPPEQDAADVSIARAALAASLPILAICRGMQVLNIVMGGTIHQHFDETTVAHANNPHEFAVVPGTRLAELLGSTRVTGFSNHHQACDRLAEGLLLAATADDGLVEGFESPDGRILGAQWHPEIDAAGDPVQQALFDWLVRAAAEHRGASVVLSGA
jgi:putative glutamine amidotransferase